MRDIYIENDRLNAAAVAIAALEPDIGSGKIEPQQILAALGLHADIWPRSILPEVIRVAVENREKGGAGRGRFKRLDRT